MVTFAAVHPEMVVLDIDGTLHVARDTDMRAHETMSAAVRAAVRAVVRRHEEVKAAIATRMLTHKDHEGTGFVAWPAAGVVVIGA